GRDLMPRTSSATRGRRAGERPTASVPAKTSGKRAGPAETPVQTGAGTSKDVMTTVVQTEPAPEEIAEIVGMDGLDAAAEAEAAALSEAEALNEAAAPIVAEVDLDDQTSTMGDSVHTYLKSIGRTSLLTAEQEVNLAKRIEAGLYAEYKLESEP